MKRTCQVCGKEFNETPSRIAQGRGKFCSQECCRQAPKGKSSPWHRLADGTIIMELTRGKVTMIDEIDLWLCQWKWYCTNNGYAARKAKNGTFVLMHRLILGALPDTQIDHANQNKLDNRRSNLRLATPQQQAGNRRVSTRNTSGYKGVSWCSIRHIWTAMIKMHGTSKYLGSFQDPTDAARAYDNAAREVFGEYANVNFA